MSKSETPRTDVIHELRKDRENLSQYFYMVDHARQLERELTAARAEITILKSKYADHHAEAERLTSEIRLVTEQRDDLLRYNEAFRKETLICTDCDSISKEEYDQAIERVDGLRSGIDYASDQLHKVTEQRDRLAEALRKCREDSVCYQERMEVLGYVHAAKGSKANIDRADEALQSLTTNKQ
jgi:predicted  nucleic acid-binding Zn-ribbon protein